MLLREMQTGGKKRSLQLTQSNKRSFCWCLPLFLIKPTEKPTTEQEKMLFILQLESGGAKLDDAHVYSD